jgi:internalin A
MELVQKLGGEVFHVSDDHSKPITKVNLSSTKVTDATLKGVVPMKSLKTLYLERTSVTDAGLKHVVVLNGLQMLDLSCTE